MLQATAVILLVLSLGLHWALLQTAAWTGMIVDFSRTTSLAQSVSDTFDGEHPCALCKIVKKGRAQEREREQKQAAPFGKLEIAIQWQKLAFVFNGDREPIAATLQTFSSRSERPPIPPPRLPSAA